MSEQLSEAIAAIKSGNKEAGKKLLLQILNEDPNHDTAWVWMSAVVEGDECWSYAYPVYHIIAVIAIFVALLSRQIRRDNVKQGILAALSFGVVYYLLLPFLTDYRWGIGTVVGIGVFVLWGRLLGALTEP